MKTTILALAALVALTTPVAAAASPKPISILPAGYTYEHAVRKLDNLKLTDCYLEQGAEIMYFRTEGRNYAANRRSFAHVYRESGRNLQITLIALDAGQELCKVSR